MNPYIHESGWPKVFEFANYSYSHNEVIDNRRQAVADGLTGYSLLSQGRAMPAYYGEGMVKIANVLGVTATSANLHTLADEILGA